MTDSLVFDQTFKLLAKSLDIAARRQSLIAGNIANLETIGYQPKELDFQKTLKNAMAGDGIGLSRTHSKHMTRNNDSNDNYDIYNLDSTTIDKEMLKLGENGGKYKTSTEFLLRKLSMLKVAITEGGR